MNSPQNNKLQFRPDIEGLRGLAVLLVIFAHANFSWIAGGFIGVDVFFVISGYLITGILQKELQAKGKVDFLNFYARRFRRLLPALAVMIIATGLVASKLLPVAELPEQASAAAAAIFWISNIYFTFKEFDYFGTTAGDNLFLHTWSLGVEEQFYLIWPLLLLALYFLSGRGRYSANTKIAVISLICMVSFFACIWATYHRPTWAYYMMPLRIWQFGIGALGFMLTQHILENVDRRIRDAALWLGVILIIGSALLLHKSTSYPGLYALAPTIGTFLLLSFAYPASRDSGLKQAWRPSTTVFLAAKPMQAMGKISYSWYLWHWPVLILGEAFFPSPDVFMRLLFIGVSWVLALASYHIIEAPIRLNRIAPSRVGWQIVAALFLMVLINSQTISWQTSAREQLKLEEHSPYLATKSDLPIIYSMGCDDWFNSSEVKPCSFGRPTAPRTAVIIGDSIGLQWFPAIQQIYSGDEWKLIAITKSACPMVDEPFFYQRIGRTYSECDQWRAELVSVVSSLKPEVLIMGSAESYGYSEEQWYRGTVSILSQVTQATKQTFIIRATPTLPFDGPRCLHQQLLVNTRSTSACTTPYDSNQSIAWQGISKAVQQFGNTRLLDMNNLVCPNQVCQAKDGSLVTYRDGQHLTATYIKSLANQLRKQLHASSAQIEESPHAIR